MKSKHSYYSEEFKWEVVQEVLSGKFTKEQARKVYGIKSNCAILYWMRKFSGNDNYRAGDRPLENSIAMSKTKKEKALEDRIKQLEDNFKREQLRADLWQKIIETAQEQLKLDIVKKYGAKQSQTSNQKKGKQ
jgi:transposase